jgi:hypothetical protein
LILNGTALEAAEKSVVLSLGLYAGAKAHQFSGGYGTTEVVP